MSAESCKKLQDGARHHKWSLGLAKVQKMLGLPFKALGGLSTIIIADPIPPASSPNDTYIPSNVPLHLSVLSKTETSDSDNEQDNDDDDAENSLLM
jgi:hypothetical protein